jgi:hypothetical protein
MPATYSRSPALRKGKPNHLMTIYSNPWLETKR